ncbi:MAG: cystathionine gamma-synthase [Thermoplasmata archaeon]
MKFSTKAIHVGQEPDKETGAVTVPIYQTSTFAQEEPAKHKGYEYSRTGNPTRAALEKNLAALENGKYGLAFASGMAAISTVSNLLKSGDHVVVCDDVYGGTYRLFQKVLTNYGLDFTYVDQRDANNVLKAIKANTKMVWIETPTNPLLKLVDIEDVSKLAKKKGVISVVDNTFASPYFQNPLDLGADIVVHSTTKYIGGHSDVIGGAVITSNADIYEKLKFVQNSVGAIPGMFDCWLLLRSVKTLAVRMERHNSNAMKIAEYLEKHPKVAKVIYPGLKSHPQHALAKKQMRGFGGMVTFELKGGFDAAKRLLTHVKIISLAESLGGVESLISHPGTMTHAAIPREERLSRGLSDGMVRLSVGIEDVEDLIGDLERALG